MSIAIVANTATFATSTTAVTPAVPDGSVGDYVLWVVPWGYAAAAAAADRPVLSGGLAASAVHVGTIFGGGGAYGTSTGPRGLSYWLAPASSATGSTDNTTFTLPGGNAGTLGSVAVRLSKASGQVLTGTFTGATDTNSADTWAPTGFTDVGATTGDLLVHAMAAIPNATNPTAVLSWTGTTLGTEANILTGNVGSGGGVRCNVRQRAVTGGPSTAAPSVAASATGLTGVHGIVRLREVAAPVARSGGFLALV